MPHRILIGIADLQKRYDFPMVCSTTSKAYLATNPKAPTLGRMKNLAPPPPQLAPAGD